MRTHMSVAVVLALVVSAMSRAETAANQDDARMQEFERRLNELEKKYQDDLLKRDAEIAALRAEMTRRVQEQPAITQERIKEQQQMLDEMLHEIETGRAVTPPEPRKGFSFNPDIAVITDFLGTWSNHRENDAYNRFDVREVELDIRAAVHPMADGVVILALENDVENPVFPTGEPLEGVETSFNAEEAYLFFHDFGIKNLTAKLGIFHVFFGRQNMLHLHDLPTSDPSFVNQAFLAPESLTDSGVSLSYVIPNPWDQYFEIVFEVLSGEGAGSESPSLLADLEVDSPATNLHALWNVDIGKEWNMELGGSWLWGHASADNALDVNLLGGDLTLMRIDPTGGFNNFVFQSEFIHGDIDLDDGSSQDSWGVYFLAQQQLNKDWYAGMRVDWTENPVDPGQEIWGVSPYVSWYLSEFLRFRVEYQHRDGDVPDADVLMFQVTWVFGAHPPEPYWRFR
jgi:hypothetical protein